MPRIKPRLGVRPSMSPAARRYVEDLIAYSSGQKKVFAAHGALTLCRFGRWLSWALFPSFRFFPGLIDSPVGEMSWETKARLSLRSDPMAPFMIGAGVGGIAYSALRFKKGA